MNFTALVNSHCKADCNSTKGEATIYFQVKKYLKLSATESSDFQTTPRWLPKNVCFPLDASFKSFSKCINIANTFTCLFFGPQVM